jgi:hypothetical protein
VWPKELEASPLMVAPADTSSEPAPVVTNGAAKVLPAATVSTAPLAKDTPVASVVIDDAAPATVKSLADTATEFRVKALVVVTVPASKPPVPSSATAPLGLAVSAKSVAVPPIASVPVDQAASVTVRGALIVNWMLVLGPSTSHSISHIHRREQKREAVQAGSD